MTRTIDLTPCPVARVGIDGGVVLPDTLDFVFTSEYALPELLIVARNGDKTEKTKTTDGTYTVPASLLFAGTIEISISLIARGEVVKRWNLEPVLIKEIDGDFTAYAAFETMQAQIAELFRRTEITL